MISVQREFVGSIVQGFAQGTNATRSSRMRWPASAAADRPCARRSLPALKQGRPGFKPSDILGLGRRAGGGPVTAGKPYVVGEHRPEVFVPNSNGRIIPQMPAMPDMSRLRTTSQGMQVTFAPQIDARGASGKPWPGWSNLWTRQRQDSKRMCSL